MHQAVQAETGGQSRKERRMDPLFIKQVLINWNRIPRSSYLHEVQALKGLREITFRDPVTFFAGENGTGKSTLLEGIAVAYGFNPEGGSRNYSFSTYDSHSELWDAMTLVRGGRSGKWGYFLRAESFYNVATKEQDYADAGHPSMRLHECSHGESFLAMMQSRMSGAGLYILDEPEAALSPQRQLTLLLEMRRAVQAGAQFLVASHSPILLGYPGAQILSFDGGRLHPVGYEQTESYQVTEMFLNNREYLLKRLWEAEE